MNWINTITAENFESSFNLKEILKNSTFYPASGIDFNNIEELLKYNNSFVHVDYSLSENTIEEALRFNIRHEGFELIGLKRIDQSELYPNGFKINNFPLTDSEAERISRREQAANYLNPFCFWAVYEFDIGEQFSLLHIGGEACATFDALYVKNGINPTAIAILNPSECYGDNWTKFTDPEYRLFGLMQLNSEKNNVSLPEYVFTNMVNDGICFWPNYELIDKKTFSRPNSKWDECYTFRLK